MMKPGRMMKPARMLKLVLMPPAATPAPALALGLALALAVAPASALAQGAAAGASTSGTEILLLGTAGGPPLRTDRSEPSSLLIVDGRMYLIDCGIGTARQLVRAGIRSELITTIFLTHLHPDHDIGLAAVMANDLTHWEGLAAAQTVGKVDIYGPPETKDLVDAAFHFVAIPYGVFAAEEEGGDPAAVPDFFVAHDVARGGEVYHDDRIRVTAVENTHYALMPARFRDVMKSYSYRIETPHGVVVFTGDTGPSDAVVRLVSGADLLVSEVHEMNVVEAINAIAKRNHMPALRTKTFLAHMTREHLNSRQVGEMASKAHVGAVLLYHWDPKDPGAVVTTVQKYFSGPVFAGADLERYCLVPGKSRGSHRLVARGACSTPVAR